MSWYANQIYAAASPALERLLKAQPLLAPRLFLVDDLRGVRSPQTLAAFGKLGGSATFPVPEQLPPGGLLAALPVIYGTGYDASEEDKAWLEDIWAGPDDDHDDALWSPARRWEQLEAPDGADLPIPAWLERKFPQRKVLAFCRDLARQAGAAVLYYHCEMWGGDTEIELAWVFEPGREVLYAHQPGEGSAVYERGARVRKLGGDVLRAGMGHLGVQMKGGFFALHECSFHWRLYHLD